ncbi:MAG TPA: hypothetical protein VE994_13905 [Terriglobales bacterium]|nr:hypothetical protein [Terriglobales bacterium]
MHRLSAFLILILSLTLALLATSCGGSSAGSTTVTQSEQGVAVTISPTTASLACSSSQQFTATVTGGSNAAVTWTVDSILGGNSTVGTVSPTGLYKAPASSGTHRVAAVSVTDASKSATSVVTVTCSSVSVSVTPSSANLVITQQQQFTATVQGTGNTGVNWSVDGVQGGNGSTGTISTSGLYTAPPQPGNHMVTATSLADGTKSGSASTTVKLAVLTERYDNARTGLNSHETVLTPANVNQGTFGLLHIYGTDGMVYGEPLYVPNVTIPGEGTHNIVIVVTENDSIYAFDADLKDAEPLWQRNFTDQNNNVIPVPTGDVGSTIFPYIGITCTPVIDPSTATVYFVTYTKEGLDNPAYVQRLHALDITTGQERSGSPVVIQGQVNGSGQPNDGQGHVLFQGKTQLQRAALLLLNGVVYIAESSHGDNLPYHGWIFGYDAHTLQQVSIWNSTPDGSAGSIWHAGAGLSADSFGNIFFITANGDFDGNSQFGDSFMKLGAENLSLFDFFTPFNESTLQANDWDLGSAGMMLIPGTRMGVGAGKEGSVYLVNLDNMGHFNPNQNNNLQFLPNVIGTLGQENNFSTPAYFNSWVYFIGNNDSVRQFQLINGLLTTSPVALSQNVFNHQGAQPVVSANGTSKGIMWAVERVPSQQNGGILHAYDATNVANELYNSNQAGSRDLFGEPTKFTVPTIINGKVYVGTQNGVAVFGLLQ